MILLSVVIRVRNEATYLDQVLSALAAQQAPFEWDVIVVDNESNDGSRETAARHNARVLTITADNFTYGRALNLGVEAAQGDLVLLLSAHSLPLGRHFLTDAVSPFARPEIGAARCIEATGGQVASWFAPSTIAYANVSEQNIAERDASWTARYPAANCCVIRRQAWLEEPFDERLEANEDKIWASRALRRGWQIESPAPAVFRYLRVRSGKAARERWDRDWLELYRFSGATPLPWRQLPGRLIVHLAANLRNGLRQTYHAIAWDMRQVTIPRRAAKARRAGGPSEFSTVEKQR